MKTDWLVRQIQDRISPYRLRSRNPTRASTNRYEWSLEDGAYFREKDREANLKSMPPGDESVDFSTIWVAECYTPVMINQLLSNVRRLGWGATEERGFMSSKPLDQWVDERRLVTEGAASIELGLITRQEDQAKWFTAKKISASLPDSVDHASATLYQPFPSLFVLAVEFQLTNRPTELIRSTMDREFQTRVEPFEGGASFIDVVSQKRDAVATMRREIRAACIEWVKRELPGAFAKTADPASYPTCELVMLELARPADPELSASWGDYIHVLDLNRDIDAWSSNELPGFRLLLAHHGSQTICILSSLLIAKRRSTLKI